MAHYEERLQKDLDRIHSMIGSLTDQIESALDNAVRALLTVNRDLAAETILKDLPINRTVREIDSLCHRFVARHIPAAGHLRYISAAMRLGVALERIGDYAVTISREAVQLSEAPPVSVSRDIEMMADQARRLFRQAMKAFKDMSPDLAKGAMSMAKQLARTFDKVFDDLLREGESRARPTKDLFALLVVFNRLERVSDQAKNICERIVFAVSGDIKAPKVYKILFVDKRNDAASKLAELYARKAFPESGAYSSAGWKPSDALDPAFAGYMDEHGLDVGDAAPHKLEAIHDELIDHHLIVDLAGDLRERLPEIPFHTLLVRWNIEADDPAGVYAEVVAKVHELVEILHGADAR